MDLLPLVRDIKDPAAMAVILWAVLELRRFRRHVGKLYTRTDSHEGRLKVLEDRAGIPVACPIRQ